MEIEVKQARVLKNPTFIDVREIYEWKSGHIEKAIHIPLSELIKGEIPSRLKRDKRYIIYCQHGIRSLKALGILQALGYRYVDSLKGGFAKWLMEVKN